MQFQIAEIMSHIKTDCFNLNLLEEEKISVNFFPIVSMAWLQ